MDGRRLLTQLVPYLPIDQKQLQHIGNAKVWFSAAGLPKQGLNSRIEFDSERVTAGFDGFLGWRKNGSYFDGTTSLKAKDLASGLALIGIDAQQQQPTSGSLDLTATLNKSGSQYRFSNMHGAISSSEVEGRATLEVGDKDKKLDIVLLTSALHFPSLFSPLLEKPLRQSSNTTTNEMNAAVQLAANVQQEVGSVDNLQKPLMSNRRFTSKLLENIRAKIRVTTDKLILSDKIIVKKGALKASIEGRQINLHDIGGELWGGKFHGKGRLDLSKTLTLVNGNLRITHASLEQSPLIIDNSPVATGKFSLNTQFEGRGISPAGLFSLLDGTGKISFSDVKIKHLSSSVLSDIVDDELAIWNQTEDQTPFKERFKRHLLHKDFQLQSLSEMFTIKDGAVLLKTAYKSKTDSKLDINASLTLASMTTHSRLSIASLKDSKYPDIPPVNINYEGSLADLDNITTEIETTSLEQFLKVMKMEHDVNLLEKMHKRDEEFALKAAKRREQARLEWEARRRREQEEAAKRQLESSDQTANPLDGNTASPQNNSPDWIPFDQGLGGGG